MVVSAVLLRHTDVGTIVVQKHIVILWSLRVCILTSSHVRLMTVLSASWIVLLMQQGSKVFSSWHLFCVCVWWGGMVNFFKALVMATFILGSDTYIHLGCCSVSNLSLIQICAEHTKDEMCAVFKKCYQALFLDTKLIFLKKVEHIDYAAVRPPREQLFSQGLVQKLSFCCHSPLLFLSQLHLTSLALVAATFTR